MPLGMKKQLQLELPGQIGMLALSSSWLDIKHIRDVTCHVILVERMAKSAAEDAVFEAARSAVQIAASIEDRYSASGRVELTPGEIESLKKTLAITMPWLRRQPNDAIYRESMALVRLYDRAKAEHEAGK